MSKQPNYVFDDETELYHHGILGQRWGHRRFQNEDGSWTAEGRERYGEGGTKSKSDVQKYKAKVTYNTQKYKADLKLKAQKEKIARAAKEEKARIKEQGKIDRAARKEQNKLDRKQAKLDKKLANEKSKSNIKGVLNRTKKYTMNDEELNQAINRLKLEVEYNKQYALASKPNGALARADRFFEGPTGKMVSQIATNTIPDVTKSIVSKYLESNLKYSNKLDREKMEADIAKTKADTAKTLSEAKKDKGLSDLEIREKEANIRRAEAQAASSESIAAQNYSKIIGDDAYDYYWAKDKKGRTTLRYKKK